MRIDPSAFCFAFSHGSPNFTLGTFVKKIKKIMEKYIQIEKYML